VINEELEFKIEQLDQMVKQWKKLYTLYRKIQKPGEASPMEEREYAEMAVNITRMYVPIATHVGLKVEPGSDPVGMMSDVSDADAIRGMSETQHRKFENDWRANNTALNQKLGEFQVLSQELEKVSAFTYYAKRVLSNRVVQWTLGFCIVIILLAALGILQKVYELLKDLINKM